VPSKDGKYTIFVQKSDQEPEMDKKIRINGNGLDKGWEVTTECLNKHYSGHCSTQESFTKEHVEKIRALEK